MFKSIFTHLHLDLDAVVSCWLIKRFVAGFSQAVIKFVPANWIADSSFHPGDFAVDISAGLKGVDVAGVHHCATWAVWHDLLSPQDRDALADLVRYVDLQDNNGDVLRSCDVNGSKDDIDMLRETGLNSIFRGIQGTLKDDAQVMTFMHTVLDGLYDKALARLRAEKEADSAEFIGSVAVVRDPKEFGTNGVLFARGAKVVVFVDGHNLGAVRRHDVTVPMGHADVKAIIPSDEIAEWFAHPAGFLFGRGTRKAPATSPSSVNPLVFAHALAQVVD